MCVCIYIMYIYIDNDVHVQWRISVEVRVAFACIGTEFCVSQGCHSTCCGYWNALVKVMAPSV